MNTKIKYIIIDSHRNCRTGLLKKNSETMSRSFREPNRYTSAGWTGVACQRKPWSREAQKWTGCIRNREGVGPKYTQWIGERNEPPLRRSDNIPKRPRTEINLKETIFLGCCNILCVKSQNDNVNNVITTNIMKNNSTGFGKNQIKQKGNRSFL